VLGLVRLVTTVTGVTKIYFMETWLLVEDFNGKSCILDKCFTSSREKAQSAFGGDGWVIGEVISEADFLAELQLNSFESQSFES
jgi:hypothetical protein